MLAVRCLLLNNSRGALALCWRYVASLSTAVAVCWRWIGSVLAGCLSFQKQSRCAGGVQPLFSIQLAVRSRCVAGVLPLLSVAVALVGRCATGALPFQKQSPRPGGVLAMRRFLFSGNRGVLVTR